MNFKKFINSDYLKNNPLCGISTYKDELNLATGDCTRKIKKLVLDGTENWTSKGNPATFRYENSPIASDLNLVCYCSHFKNLPWQQVETTNNSFAVEFTSKPDTINIKCDDYSTVEDFKAFLATQYAAGTPVTVWYVLDTPTTETVTVPTGLSGTEEGYLNQSGTPTPTNPIYPTANTVEKWFDINHYIMGTSTDTITTLPAVVYPNATTATVGLKGQAVQSATPTPQNPIMPQGTGERTRNLLNFNALKSAPSGRMPSSTYTFEHLLIINVEPNTAYTISSTGTGSTGGAAADNRSLYINGTGDNEVVFVNHPITKTTGADGLLYVGFESSRSNAAQYLNGTAVITLNIGSTPLPYEPYGYFIEIEVS